MANILVCDDDKDIVSAIEIYLLEDGHIIFKAFDGYQALDILEKEDIQLVILDIMMPEMSGIEVAEKIRETSEVPIIFLSAKSEESDKVDGLNAGGDDYVTKPFSPAELTARVRSNLRRYTQFGNNNESNNSHIYSAGALCINDESKSVTVDGEQVKLTPIEYNILLLLLKNKGTVFSTDKIFQSIWNETPIATDNTVAVHIRHIREKIEINPGQPKFLKVVWGVGYKIEDI
ncbi:MAG: response regulator transcription factor [Lachnospiraceae bacterium]|nr:response regulator transcription factor [Lachnospiraceae bacterium]